jgi:hypothetical protein
MSGNSCDCPNPPGGRVTCRADQLAICRVIDGRIESQCIDKPTIDQSLSDRAKETTISNWVLGIIKGEKRSPTEEINKRDRDIMRSGRYQSPETKEVVTFSLPREIEVAVEEPAGYLVR